MNTLTRWRPFGEINPVQREVGDIFERLLSRQPEFESWPATAAGFPANISENDDHIVVTAEIPGLEPKDIDISVTGDVLTLKAEKKQEKEEKNENFHRVERVFGSFSRSFRLPSSVVLDKVAADYKNGVLRVTLPKTDDSKRREVKVKVG
jgi:HSP20 family protein